MYDQLKKLEAPEKVINNADKLLKPTSYDIRAYVGEPGNFFSDDAVFTPQSAEVIGKILGSQEFILKTGVRMSLKVGEAIVIGYDNGPTSEALAKAMAKGLMDMGVNVYDIGVASSGQVYQNQNQLGAIAHIQITRSHVEVTTNGAKFGISTQGVHTYLLEQMNTFLKEKYLVRNVPEEHKGITLNKKEEGRKAYYDKMISVYASYFKKRDNSMVCVNLFGGTGLQYKELFKQILGEHCSIIGTDIDVNSGQVLADPTRKEMLAKVPGLSEALKGGKRVHSFDLDADRGSITEGADALDSSADGHYLGDSLAFILADYKMKIAIPELMAKLQAEKVNDRNLKAIEKVCSRFYIDARYTGAVKQYVEDMGGETIFHPKGHSLWKETITANMKTISSLSGFTDIAEFAKETGYRDLQIEASLHMFSTDTDDGIPRDDAVENIFILEQIIDRLSINSLHAYFSSLPKRFTTKEIRTVAENNEKKDLITADAVKLIKNLFADRKGFDTTLFEGQIRVDFPEGFIMYGMSNTSPKLTFMAEGADMQMRNNALAFLLGIHNGLKEKYEDASPMDLAENSFFTNDKTFELNNPDIVTISDSRFMTFAAHCGIRPEDIKL
ncbi:phosphoglucomutase/phosphomannomutase alpha/beta/alpha domain I [Denitrovibrio acetiphilus DSM 12809]|uniref:Phosphoglucomutase/phosphomannomutase alpha/beta/alpha domain I n=1 Tax=Denitrovibrio acetiphilus (strain DSM 12809 / NBRC 114555 / N2460) TaxID=522772 RepID=D4H5T2_DENA2|nr:phosphoglucomutase/phosphomannomutase alpha/beta/alpha domain I [Denitrovibrio acetiphilus]ADD69523.1 phosphoglucomutase/phosphomannomutase alpha/beta/alpha domain I [Denitrovibrio acetiphilus DSM 12809]